MKMLLFLLFSFSAGMPFQNQRALDALVFDFTSDLKSTLPDDGWVKMNFSVVHYENQPLNVTFKATCIESGMDLPFYPPAPRFQLNTDEVYPITLFMNEKCGVLENLPAGQHRRSIRFQFVDIAAKDTLAFEQDYVIEVPAE